MNRITVKVRTVSDYRIDYDFEIVGEWKNCFKNEQFFVEYTKPVKNINDSVAIIPVMGSLLPISWLFDAEIKIDEIDEMFYNSIPEFKKGYEAMYPQFKFGGKVTADKIIKNEHGGNGAAALFSGGVDAFSTLLSHLDEKPDLITIWGADVDVNNENGWKTVEKHRDEVIDTLGLNGITIKSSLRKSVDEGYLTQFISKKINENWWHGFFHGIGMLALTAPVAFLEKYKTIYIASSFSNDDIGKYTAASDPTIDNYVKFCGCSVVHDGFEFCRQDKIHNICEYSEKSGIKIPIRACWQSDDGSNCCECEKCFRTVLGIYAERKNPHNFGFEYDDDNYFKSMKNNSRINISFRYNCIQEAIRKNYNVNNIHPDLKWFYRTDVVILERKYKLKILLKKFFSRLKRVPKKIFKKIFC